MQVSDVLPKKSWISKGLFSCIGVIFLEEMIAEVRSQISTVYSS